MEKIKGWRVTETIGFSIINPRSCFKVEGSPEDIERLLLYIKNICPEQLDQKLIEELDEK